MKSKEDIREIIRQKLKDQDPVAAREASLRIQGLLFEREEFKRSRNLLIYLSKRGEVDTLGVVRRCLKMGKQVIVPRVDDVTGELDLRVIQNLTTDVEPGSWGLTEPRISRTRAIGPEEVDCAVIPGLAFDKKGNRLGRGKGYFDKLLSRIPQRVPRIGFAFSFQIMDVIPADTADQRMSVVLSS